MSSPGPENTQEQVSSLPLFHREYCTGSHLILRPEIRQESRPSAPRACELPARQCFSAFDTSDALY
jgi:hypothetical protein